MQYTVTEQEVQMIRSDLLSNFGGVLGLFLGMSFLSLFEIVYLAWKLFQGLISFVLSKKKLKKQISLINPTAISLEVNGRKQSGTTVKTRVKPKTIRKKFLS